MCLFRGFTLFPVKVKTVIFVAFLVTRCFFQDLFFPQPSDISPEERAQNVGRVLRKEADDVMTKWDRLNTDSTDWQRRLELALDRLMELQEAEDLLDGQLRQAEMVKEAWEPVGDLLIDSLPENIDKVKVRLSDVLLSE